MSYLGENVIFIALLTTHDRGTFFNGMLHGTVVEIDPQDSSVREVHYKDGAPFGTYRHRRMDGQLLGYGKMLGDVKVEASTNPCSVLANLLAQVGPQLVVGAGGNSFYLGCVARRGGKLAGAAVFLYPCLRTAITGHWEAGKLVRGQYRTLAAASLPAEKGVK